MVIGLNFKCALDSENTFEASHCIKQEWKTNRNSPGPNLYGWVARSSSGVGDLDASGSGIGYGGGGLSVATGGRSVGRY
ncbi:hypothetical protein T459_23758 [Capsicum annuum]|uniref:XS domain-containing protein n=1 Tax=Capsicum annuum TaxID=4072 RepID=A0A2G2YTB9_CAPAN|nr:hypothetical protein T459_23758 [Capsicum annuum]